MRRDRAFNSSRSWTHDTDWIKTEGLKNDIRCLRTDSPCAGLGPELFDRILAWKLRGQRGRTERRRSSLTPQVVALVTQCAFSLQHSSRAELAGLRLRVLSSMPGIGPGVASAILALSFPDMYGVIDSRVWEVIFKEERTSFTPADYQNYLAELWKCAEHLGIPPQSVDFLTWKYGEIEKAGQESEMRP